MLSEHPCGSEYFVAFFCLPFSINRTHACSGCLSERKKLVLHSGVAKGSGEAQKKGMTDSHPLSLLVSNPTQNMYFRANSSVRFPTSR